MEGLVALQIRLLPSSGLFAAFPTTICRLGTESSLRLQGSTGMPKSFPLPLIAFMSLHGGSLLFFVSGIPALLSRFAIQPQSRSVAGDGH